MTNKKLNCEYCNNKFSTKPNLLAHQRKAQYCLKLRVNNNDNNILKCKGCEKTFSCKQNTNKHQIKCVNYIKLRYEEDAKKTKDETRELERKHKFDLGKLKLEYKEKISQYKKQMNEIKLEHKEEIRELQDKLENVAIKAATKQTTTNNIQQNNNQKINQIINNMLPLTDEHFREQAQYLTLDHIKNGADGYAKYALEYPLKDRVVCVDFSRRKLKYKNADGEVVVDPEMGKISQKLFTAVEDRNTQLIGEYTEQLKNKLYGSDNNVEMTETEVAELNVQTDYIIDHITEMVGQRRELSDAAKGLKPDMYHSFIRNVCSKAVK